MEETLGNTHERGFTFDSTHANPSEKPMTRTVELVATKDVVLRYYPNRDVVSSVLTAQFPIQPGECETALGQWLASHVMTTHFDDDASNCLIVLPDSQASLYLSKMADDLRTHTCAGTRRELESAAAYLASQLEDLRSLLRVFGARPILSLQSMMYRWPVFNRQKAFGMTPEGYFDYCATDIQRSGGVIEYVGLFRKPLPEELVKGMAGGRGAELLRRHKARSSASTQ